MVVRAETAPADATFPALVWSSADETVATVSAGLVKGLKAGTVTITVMATDGSEVSETLEVKVVESTEPEPVVEDYAINFDKDADGKSKKTNLEVDFIASDGMEKYYIQSAYALDNEPKKQQELNALQRIDDSFRKIVIIGNDIAEYTDTKGIRFMGLYQFLMSGLDKEM